MNLSKNKILLFKHFYLQVHVTIKQLRQPAFISYALMVGGGG